MTMKNLVNWQLIWYILTFRVVPTRGRGYWWKWLFRDASVLDIIAHAPYRATSLFMWLNNRKIVRLERWLARRPR